jgi:serpin B
VDKCFELKPDFAKPSWEQIAPAVFSADFKQPDKEAGRMNEWISAHTEGHISDLVKPDSVASASVVVADAVYFKAEWQQRFDAAKTREEPFHFPSGETVQVPMMNEVEVCQYAEQDGIKILKLPYKGFSVSMLLVLPKPGAEGWAAMEAKLMGGWCLKTMDGAGWEDRAVAVKLPRWKIACEPPSCISVLQSMGVKRLFEPSQDFTGISNNGPLFVSAFMHRTWVEVNEKGTEAAATTTGVLWLSADATPPPPPKPATFIADHPFLFVIRHDATGTPLFVGRVSNPVAKQP